METAILASIRPFRCHAMELRLPLAFRTVNVRSSILDLHHMLKEEMSSGNCSENHKP